MAVFRVPVCLGSSICDVSLVLSIAASARSSTASRSRSFACRRTTSSSRSQLRSVQLGVRDLTRHRGVECRRGESRLPVYK